MKGIRITSLLLPAMLAAAPATGCESEVETYDGGRDTTEVTGDDGAADVPDDGTGDAAGEAVEDTVEASDDGGPVATASCPGADGVSVSGTVFFDGAFPGTSRLWLVWMDELGTPGMPHCILEVAPVAFPAAFRFTDVPRGVTWALQGLLDVSGGYPPLPAAEDFAGGYRSGTIDLSGDVAGLVITLEPYAP
jgi:hypothetical protein